MTSKSKSTFAAVGAVVALAIAAPVAQAKVAFLDNMNIELRHGADDAAQKPDDAQARGREAEPRQGADDPAADDRGVGEAEARNGADDPAGDDSGAGEVEARNGADDPAGDDAGAAQVEARNGADDPAGDDHRGRGGDDGANHG